MLVADPLVVACRVETEEGNWLVVADFRDQSDVLSKDLLRECHVYLKRSYYAPDLNSFGEEAAKVRPLGLNYACRSPGLACAVFTALAPGVSRSPRQAFRFLRKLPRFWRAVPPAGLFERTPNDPREPTVIFQTRVWEEGDTGQEPVDAINEPRVALVRALRQAFGPCFRGGLVPTPLARRRYPDVVAQGDWRKTAFIRMSSRQSVVVCTRGLHHSTAWRITESMAAAQCLVVEPPRNALPVPLVEGTHFLGFVSPDECVAACRAMLNDPARACAMREANYQYYRAEIAPAVWVANRLAEVTARPTTCKGEKELANFCGR